MSEPTLSITAECPVCGTKVLDYEIERPHREVDGRPGPASIRRYGAVLAPVKFKGYSPTLLVIQPCGHRLARWLLYAPPMRHKSVLRSVVETEWPGGPTTGRSRWGWHEIPLQPLPVVWKIEGQETPGDVEGVDREGEP